MQKGCRNITGSHSVGSERTRSRVCWDNIHMAGILLLLLNCLVLLNSSALAATIPMERGELIQRSEFIFVGQVESKQSRWNAQGNMIVTDYVFRVDEVLYGSDAKKLELTFAGGQLPEEGQSVSDVPEFSLGDQVLLMVESLNQPLFSPVTGMNQGAYWSVNNATGVKDGLGRSVREGGTSVAFGEFVDLVRKEIPVVKAMALPQRTVEKQWEQFVIKDLPQKRYDSFDTGMIPAKVLLPAMPEEGEAPRLPATEEIWLPDEGAIEQLLSPEPKWSYSHRAKNVPIVFNPLPSGGLIGDHDQYQMAYWNKYADIYRVMTPTGTWAWKNGRYDIAGFVDNATMVSQFGEGWGASTLAICWKRWGLSGYSIEADVAMNPAFSWTTNDFATYYNSGLFNADRTLLHEIGHAWGLDHQFNALSVMNYAPHKYRAYTELYMDDAAAVKAAFSSHTVSRTDLGVVAFYSSGYQSYSDSHLSTTSVVRGGSVTVSDFIVENSGTTTISQPLIKWYLVPNIGSWSGSIYIGNTTHSSLAPNTYFRTSRILSIPVSVPTGNYYLAAYADVSGDALGENDSSWLDRQITITAPDLIVQSPSVNDATLIRGQGYLFYATVKNQGNGPSAGTTLKYYRSTNSFISTSDTEIGTDAVSALVAGSTSPESIALTAPSSDGTWWIGACVVSVSGESNAGNQCSTGVKITVTSPDLVTQNPSASKTSLTPGASFMFSATVKNQGTRTSSASTLRYFRSTNSIISTYDTEIGTDYVASLSAGVTSPESISLSAPASDGTWWIGACVDAVAYESNTTNQCSTGVKITVTTPYYTVGGSLSGLASGNTLVLQNNGSDDLSLSANGSFIFDTALVDGSSYAVTVLTQPTSPNQVCAVTNGSGTLSGANVTNVSVVCTTVGYHVGGNVDGLFNGYDLVLTNNGGDDLTITDNGRFIFATPVPDGGSYSVAILTQPDHPKHHCTVANGNGTVAGGNVSDVSVTCVVDQLFTDVPPNHWAYDSIQTLAMSGITGGCGGTNYCPGDQVSRAQMAVFLERGIQGSDFVPPPATGSMFTDVPDTYWAAAWIEQLASDGISGGCGGGNYCPDNIVTRDQMAVFLLRSKYGSSYVPPAATGAMFDDVPADHWAADWIEELAVEGVTGGCDASNYCPDAEVSRDQMAVFLVKTFGL